VPRGERIARDLPEKLDALDAQLFLLRGHALGLRDDMSHIKMLAAGLRALVCLSSGTEGLLWRVADELGARAAFDDGVDVHAVGPLQLDHPLAQGLEFAVVPLRRAGEGDPRIPAARYRLRDLIREHEAVVAKGVPVTHETLIKWAAQQMGAAHEDDSLEPALAQIASVLLWGVRPLAMVLSFDAEMTLEVGERLLALAEQLGVYWRSPRAPEHGNVSVLARVQIRTEPTSWVPLCALRSHVSDVDVAIAAGPAGVRFAMSRSGGGPQELLAAWPVDWRPGDDTVSILSYGSGKRRARAITNGRAHDDLPCDMGWLHADDMRLRTVPHNTGVARIRFVLVYARLLSPHDARHALELPPDAHGLWETSDESAERGPFPG